MVPYLIELFQIKVLHKFWSERRCSGGLAEQGNAVVTKFIVLFSLSLSSSSGLITHSVVVVVNFNPGLTTPEGIVVEF